ncbi:hypothetical protein PSEUDO8Z_100392 [Pseudomonas sp. 8Z]|nr:hypothetical protein PSEUDO8Z_100392 [Pseudomonas sp. 8Z]
MFWLGAPAVLYDSSSRDRERALRSRFSLLGITDAALVSLWHASLSSSSLVWLPLLLQVCGRRPLIDQG